LGLSGLCQPAKRIREVHHGGRSALQACSYFVSNGDLSSLGPNPDWAKESVITFAHDLVLWAPCKASRLHWDTPGIATWNIWEISGLVIASRGTITLSPQLCLLE
jgi:hypothetical protein